MNAESSEPVGEASLTDVGVGLVYGCVSVGTSLKDAAECAGVPVSVIRARRQSDPMFERGLRQAIHKGKVHHLTKITKSAAWQASAWVLERRWRRQFRRNQPGEERPARKREMYDWGRLTVEQQRQMIALLRLALLSRGKKSKSVELPAADGDADARCLPGPDAGADRSGPVPGEPA